VAQPGGHGQGTGVEGYGSSVLQSTSSGCDDAKYRVERATKRYRAGLQDLQDRASLDNTICKYEAGERSLIKIRGPKPGRFEYLVPLTRSWIRMTGSIGSQAPLAASACRASAIITSAAFSEIM